MDTFKINRSLITLNRYCGYLLIVFILFFFATGIGRLKGGIPHHHLKFIHEELLPVPTFIAFLTHALLSIRMIVMRKVAEDMRFWNIFFIILGAVLFTGFLHFYLR